MTESSHYRFELEWHLLTSVGEPDACRSWIVINVMVPLFILQAVSFIKVIYRNYLRRLLERAFIQAFFILNWRTIGFSTIFDHYVTLKQFV